MEPSVEELEARLVRMQQRKQSIQDNINRITNRQGNPNENAEQVQDSLNINNDILNTLEIAIHELEQQLNEANLRRNAELYNDNTVTNITNRNNTISRNDYYKGKGGKTRRSKRKSKRKSIRKSRKR